MYTERLLTPVTVEMKDNVQQAALRKGISGSEWLRRLIQKGLDSDREGVDYLTDRDATVQHMTVDPPVIYSVDEQPTTVLLNELRGRGDEPTRREFRPVPKSYSTRERSK